MRDFPDDFLFGTATSAYQVEGATAADGRTPSIWDWYSSRPGAIRNGDTAERASMHYYRFAEDVGILRDLGVDSYRFSIAWPRIIPRRGRRNPAGIAFYDRLIDLLLETGIAPMVTMNHWDLPLWAFERGGWENRESVGWFLEYERALLDAYGDRVPLWITHNEPFCITMLGYMKGLHAPGVKDYYRGMRVAHHLLLSHGEAVREFRKRKLPGAGIGITLNIAPAYPADPGNPADREMAVRADGFVNRWFLEPLFSGRYPDDLREVFEARSRRMDFIEPGDMERIREQCDFFGLNYYNRHLVKATSEGPLGYLGVPEPAPATYEGWSERSPCLLALLKDLSIRYTGSMPIYITENGLGRTAEAVRSGGVQDDGMTFTWATSHELRDSDRIAYLRYHLEQCSDFIRDGGNLKGYFLWSLLDNFEWALGYTMRFGLVHVDYATGKRTPKDSARFYADVIRNRAVTAGVGTGKKTAEASEAGTGGVTGEVPGAGAGRGSELSENPADTRAGRGTAGSRGKHGAPFSAMTRRERMLTAMRGGTPDRVPVAPDISNMIPCRLTGKPFREIYYYGNPKLGDAYMDAARFFGIDGWYTYGGIRYVVPGIGPRTDEITADAAGVLTVRTTIDTGAGLLYETAVYPVADPPTVVEKMVKNFREDFPKLKRLFAEPVSCDPSPLERQKRSVGEDGVLCCPIDPPGFQIWMGLFDGNLQAAIYAWAENPELFDELRELHERQSLKKLEMFLDFRPDSILTGGSGSITLQSPELWERYSLPTIRKITGMCREAGVISGIHSCGKERCLVERTAAETDLDYVNPIEIPPMGDCTLPEARAIADANARCGKRMCVMGNLHTTDVMLFGGVELVRYESLKAIRDAGVGGAFVLSTGDQCGRDTPDENIREMVRTVEEFGRYPLDLGRIDAEMASYERKTDHGTHRS